MRVQNIVFVFFCTLNFQVLGVALSRKSNRENGSTAVIARMDPEILQYSVRRVPNLLNAFASAPFLQHTVA